jgi:two-component system sensor histidine kinase UhpB
MNILVVEDNEGDFFLVQEYLEINFSDLLITHNTLLEEAIGSLLNNRYDIILLDLSLPDSTGKDSIEHVIKMSNGSPVIVLTGLSDRQIAIDSLKLGVQDYLIKDEVNAFVLQKSISYSIERNNISKNLRDNEKKYRYLFDNNPDSIFIISPSDLNIIDVNETASKLLGYSRAAFLQMNLNQISIENEPDNIKTLTSILITSNLNIKKGIIRHITLKNDILFLDMALHKINYNGQEAILAIGSDVTHKIKLEKSLEEERTKKNMEITQAVISAQEKERQELGLELHDNVNQILAGSLMYLGLLKIETKSNSDLFLDIDKLLTSAIQEIRKLSHSLLPPSLNELSLSEALDHIITIAKKSRLFEIKKDLDNFREYTISDAFKLAIYRIVQEQFNNIFKHSNAKNILIQLYHEENNLILVIADDGNGFDTSSTSNGVGLINIQTRASLFNGTMHITSAPKMGTEIRVIFLDAETYVSIEDIKY